MKHQHPQFEVSVSTLMILSSQQNITVISGFATSMPPLVECKEIHICSLKFTSTKKPLHTETSWKHPYPNPEMPPTQRKMRPYNTYTTILIFLRIDSNVSTQTNCPHSGQGTGIPNFTFKRENKTTSARWKTEKVMLEMMRIRRYEISDE